MNISQLPILSDFNRFLDYIAQKPVLELTKDKGVLRSKDLIAINDLLEIKAPKVTPKSQQPAFSLINTFFHIGVASKMLNVQKNATNRTAFLHINPARIQKYDAMNDLDKYFFLFESFWCYVDWDKAYDCRSFWDKEVYFKLMTYPIGKMVSIGDYDLKRKGELSGLTYTFAAEVFSAFGFLDMIWDENLEKRPSSYQFPYAFCAPTELGKRLLPVLFEKRPPYKWHNSDPYNDNREYFFDDGEEAFDDDEEGFVNMDEPDDEIEEDFIDAFLPLLDGQTIENRMYPIERVLVKGTYLLKVALDKDLYRVLEVGGSQHTFEDFHLAIQEAFDFGNDHLYAFFMNGEPHSQSGDRFFHPEALMEGLDGNKPADAFCVGEVGLFVGMQFLYHFDFGYSWYFYITVMSILEGDTEPETIQVVESKGEAPPQYEDDYDEEEDDDQDDDQNDPKKP